MKVKDRQKKKRKSPIFLPAVITRPQSQTNPQTQPQTNPTPATKRDYIEGIGGRGDSIALEKAMKETNPSYYDRSQPDYKYHRNCQRVVYAYEAMRRGYNVEALPRPTAGFDRMACGGWRDVMKNANWVNVGARGVDNAVKKLEDQMRAWGDGARAVVNVKWDTYSGHVFNVENVGGKIVCVDAQPGRIIDLSTYLSAAQRSKTQLCRVDNLEFDPKMIKRCAKERS